MVNFFIKALGGYTEEDVAKLSKCIAKLQKQLEEAQRNDTPKDPKTGRFVKKKK